MSDRHVTTPHGWSVNTDAPEGPLASPDAAECPLMGDVLVQLWGGEPRVLVRVASGGCCDGPDYEAMSAAEARALMATLAQAIQIAEATERGDYVWPASTHQPPRVERDTTWVPRTVADPSIPSGMALILDSTRRAD